MADLNTNNAADRAYMLGQLGLTDPALLPKWRAARAKVRGERGDARILLVGDSNTISINAAGVMQNPSLSKSVAQILTARGLAANDDGFSGCSTGASTGGRLVADPRIAAGSWVAGTAPTCGGFMAKAGAVAGASWSFTPEGDVDTFRVIMPRLSGLGTVRLQAGSGSTVDVSQAGATGALTQIVTADALGSKALTAIRQSGGDVYLAAVEAYNSSIKSVHMINAGWWGSRAGSWAAGSAAFDALPMINTIGPDLTILKPGKNDWSFGNTVEVFMASVVLIVEKAQLSGDVLVVTPAPDPNATVLQASYIAALRDYCFANGIALVDTWTLWESYAAANALGYYSDPVHPNEAGYADEAFLIAKALLS